MVGCAVMRWLRRRQKFLEVATPKRRMLVVACQVRTVSKS